MKTPHMLRLAAAPLLICGLLAGLWPAGDADAAPLLQEGKKSLYQRVVSHPGAQLFPTPDASGGGRPLRSFTVLYVYARQGGKIQVGAGPHEPEGWMDADRSTRWDQSLTLLFSPRTGRDPVLFFKSERELRALCEDDRMEARIDDLLKAAASGTADPSLPILASEPDDARGAVSRRRFYLMPILKTTAPLEVDVKFLQVASIDPGTAGGAGGASGAAKGRPKMGLAIVMDTSISMRPYIEQSRNVVRAIYDRLEREKLSDSMGFAVVAFRSSTKKTPGLEYAAKVVSDFATAANRSELEQRLAQVDEARVSSHDFNEDAFAGIRTALESLSWDDYSSRLILLVTDAGPLRPDDQYRSTEMDAAAMRDLALQKGVRPVVLHVKSPSGRANHAYAERCYRALSLRADTGSDYMSVNAATPQQGAREFAERTRSMAEGMVTATKATVEGRLITRPKEVAKALSPADEARLMAERLGYAMQLEYLGRANETRAPGVVSSWIADKDLKLLAQSRPVFNVEPAVLLTKNQLGDLATQLRIIIDNADRTRRTASKDFFQGILSASAQMARDPNAPTQGRSLAELGVLAEFLDGLPYRSEVMNMREDDWYRKSIGDQAGFVNRLKSLLARYQEYDRDRDNWESFGQADSGEWMYRVPLSMLP